MRAEAFQSVRNLYESERSAFDALRATLGSLGSMRLLHFVSFKIHAGMVTEFVLE